MLQSQSKPGMGSRCESTVGKVRSDAERVVGGENERPALWAFVWLRLLYASKYASGFPELGPPTALTAQCQSRSIEAGDPNFVATTPGTDAP